jgi:hypothetical protein
MTANETNASVTLNWGHRYGKSFGLREIRKMTKLVEEGRYKEVRRNYWSVRSEAGALQESGYEATFRKIA